MKKQRMTPEETRHSLVAAGLHLFGLKGFEGTRTRELAQQAGVNQAAIPYHFGGKEGLYRAVAKYVVQRGREDLEPEVSVIMSRITQGILSRNEAGELYIRFLCAFLDRIVTADDITDRSRFVFREYSSPGAGFDIIYEGLLEGMHKMQCVLVGSIIGKDPESEEVILKTHTIFGTIISNVMARTLLFKRIGWDGYDADKLEKIKKIIAEVVTNGVGLDGRTNMESL